MITRSILQCIMGLLFLLVAVTTKSTAEERGNPANAPAADHAVETPDWAQTTQPPLWSFAWVSDMHLDSSRLEYMAKAMDYIRTELKPHFVLLTGDNNSLAASSADTQHPESLGVRQQRFLKAFLEKHLKLPYLLVTADNWMEGFDKVFGPHQFSFDCGGLHFILLDPDRMYHGSLSGPEYEGLSVFEKSTWDWIRQDLERHRQTPTIVALHEPICPPTFLDAPPLRALVEHNSNVVAVLQGHLHVDMDRRCNGVAYLVAPALGKPPAKAMKLVHVYPRGLVVRTIHYDEAGDRFGMLGRRQAIEIAQPLRDKLSVPAGPGFSMTGYDAIPAHPIVIDSTLEVRAGELLKNAANYLLFSK
jgi:hypothetical protein